MKFFFAVVLIILQLNSCVPEDTGFVADVDSNTAYFQKRVAASVKDLLSHISCRYLKQNGYCKYSLIQDKLCYITCRCDDVFSQKSCGIVKGKNKCDSSWGTYYCKFTCDRCSPAYHVNCTTSAALGMKSRAIPDSSINASSIYDQGFPPSRARLDTRREGSNKKGAWATKTKDLNQWLQVDLGQVTKVTHIATQGRQDWDEWVKTYSIEYGFDGRSFSAYKDGKIFAGNTNRYTIVKHAFSPPIIARYIRVRPKTWHNWIAMRMELYGCR